MPKALPPTTLRPACPMPASASCWWTRPQAILTILYGIDQQDELEHTIYELIKAYADDEEVNTGSCILYSHTVDLIPSSIELSALEIPLYS